MLVRMEQYRSWSPLGILLPLASSSSLSFKKLSGSFCNYFHFVDGHSRRASRSFANSVIASSKLSGSLKETTRSFSPIRKGRPIFFYFQKPFQIWWCITFVGHHHSTA